MRFFSVAITHLRLVRQRQDGGIDGGGVDQRLVALDIDDNVGIFSGCNFCNPICTRKVIGARHPYKRSEQAGCV